MMTSRRARLPKSFLVAVAIVASFVVDVSAFTPQGTGSTFGARYGRKLGSSSSSNGIVMSPTALAMGLTLYGHPGTRSPLINWACYELGADLAMGDLSKNPHPFGQIPCLTDDDGVVVFESGAILQYIHQKHAPESLSKEQVAAVLSWIVWANASLDPICFLETPDGKVYDTGLKNPNRRIAQLNEILLKQEYLVDGAGFTLADVATASYLLYVVQFFPKVFADAEIVNRWPALIRYMKSCANRPAYGKAFGEQTQAYLVDILECAISKAGDKKKVLGMF